MASENELIALVLQIAKQTPEGMNDNHRELIELIKLIGHSTKKLHIEIDYDGREFHWKTPVKDLKASDFIRLNS